MVQWLGNGQRFFTCEICSVQSDVEEGGSPVCHGDAPEGWVWIGISGGSYWESLDAGGIVYHFCCWDHARQWLKAHDEQLPD